MKRIYSLVLAMCFLQIGCSNDLDDVRQDAKALAERIAALEAGVATLNQQISNVYTLMSGSTVIVGVTPTATGYKLEMSDGTTLTIYKGAEIDHLQPIYGVNAAGNWIVSLNGGTTFDEILDKEGNAVSAQPADGEDGTPGAAGVTPKLKIDAKGYWMASLDGGTTYEHLLDAEGKYISAVSGTSYSGFFSEVTYDETAGTLKLETLTDETIELPVVNTFSLAITHEKEIEPFLINEKRTFAVEQVGVAKAMIQAPKGWTVILGETDLVVTAPDKDANEEIKIAILSDKQYVRIVTLPVSCSQGTPAWQAFYTHSEDNILLDFSFAGYKHGEVGPPDVSSLGYDTFNVLDYGAIANDGKSDRAAFIAAYEAAKVKGKGIIYFPEGEFDLHSITDDNKAYSEGIILTMGDLVIKGAGRDLTTILMSAPNIPQDPEIMYGSAVTINIKHNSGLVDITTVTGDSAKGSFSVEVASGTGLKTGDWVCLTLENNTQALILKELGGSAERFANINNAGYQIIDSGVTVYDYHQIKSVSGNTVTFVEPLMHEVESQWNWKIQKYNHYENVGVEDITFKGNAKSDFLHHGTWQDDGAYKPINFMRLTNSWMRRVRFTSVSECSSIVSCANVSVYDVEIDGNRGHSAIRSQGSSRVFIGKVTDKSSGPSVANPSSTITGAGQYHAVGISKQSMGAVLWRNNWGSDSNFESHATQPRATLFDCCKGGFHTSRQGGDMNQMPNHLDDLTIWNFTETVPATGNYIKWWDYSSKYWKFMPPTIVGYQGQVEFEAASTKLDESHGTHVYPESLYEAQLINRLGALPAWLSELK